jgi:hypothetical protein
VDEGLLRAWEQAERTGRGFRVERIAPSTYLHDCLTSVNPREWADRTLGRSKANGPLYRCRVGRGKWVYADNPAGAILGALALGKE